MAAMSNGPSSGDTNDTLFDTADAVQRVPVNVYPTTDALVIVAPMPGVMADDVSITLDGNTIDIRAELRTEAPKPYLVHEWDYGHFARSLQLPEGFGGAALASLGHGQLAVRIERGDDRKERSVIKPTNAGQAA